MLSALIRQRGGGRIKACCFQSYRHYSNRYPILEVAEEIREAVHSGKPVVALESTIYTHGFPYPENIALSSLLESKIRTHGGIPATIGILQGVAKVGMQPEEIIQLLETSGEPDTIKVSRRDLGFICASGINGRKLNGGTTIAGTLVLAHLAGIKVFATGGLGGVHKGGENSMDVSADLTELGRTPVALVSSGCKSFLDIPRTLEYLETQGVGVATFADGRAGKVNFPAFWTRESGTRSPKTINTEKDAAAVIYAQRQLSMSSGLLFANPIPEEFSLPETMIDNAMAQAVRDAEERGISGSENTPYVLSRIREITKGATVDANRVLVESNAIRGTKVAVELAKFESNDMKYSNSESLYHSTVLPIHSSEEEAQLDVLVAGSVAVDLSCDYSSVKGQDQITPLLNTSNPSEISHSIGGVGSNVATACHYVGARTQLCSIIGDDIPGKAIMGELQRRDMSTEGIKVLRDNAPTAQYVAVNDAQKDLVLAMADMRILEGHHSVFEDFWKPLIEKKRPKWLVIDGNWDPLTLQKWFRLAKELGIRVVFEPVSVEKSVRLLHEDWKSLLGKLLEDKNAKSKTDKSNYLKIVDVSTPNELEVIAMAQSIRGMDAWTTLLSSLPEGFLEARIQKHLKSSLESINSEAAAAAFKLLSRIPSVYTKLGASGVLLVEALGSEDPRLSDPKQAEYIICFKPSSIKTSISTAFPLPESEDSNSMDHIAAVYMRHFPIPNRISPEDIVSVNGVGDTFVGILVAGLAKGSFSSIEQLIDVAQKGAALTLQSKYSVSPEVRQLL